MSIGVWIAVVAVALSLAVGFWRARTEGRFGQRRTSAASGGVLEGTPWAAQLGERATLLQFSSAFCAPCRATRQVLSDVSTSTPGIAHVEVDAEQHLNLVRRLGILKTPTTLILDADGTEIARASGAARQDQVLAALSAVR